MATRDEEKGGMVGWAGPFSEELIVVRMQDIALTANGAQIVMVSSQHENFPANNMIDGKLNTFWSTTGLYPQSFVLALPNITTVENVTFYSYNVKRLTTEKSSESEPTEFKPYAEIDLQATDGSLQKVTFGNERNEARYLRFTIEAGHDHFCAVYKVQVDGSLM
ncbi:intraflagellar transport protein 25 homolog [Centruroides vittatus]|uniref:intraflagellar transport protein 25 homolog n=1 Tax=Centruroides vittatus TaxID=120091 RepID=UPI00351066A4